MRNILCLIFIAIIALSAPACSKKSGCPTESTQAQVDKNGNYKASKTKSGLIPPKGYKAKKGKFKPKRKEKHSN